MPERKTGRNGKPYVGTPNRWERNVPCPGSSPGAAPKFERSMKKENVLPKKDEKADIIVPIGDLSNEMILVESDSDYEDMTEDFIATFNNAVMQGQKPTRAIFAFASAFAVVLGCFIRAGLRQEQVGRLLMLVGKNTAAASKMVKILQNQSVGRAVSNVVKAGKRKVN